MPRIDAPYVDPSRGRAEAPSVFSRLVRLIGMAMFLTGLAIGCYAGLRWLQVGHGDLMLLSDVIVEYLPDRAQTWIIRPRSWFGLHRIVVWVLRIPMFASMAFVGFLLLLASTASGRK